MYGKTLRSCTGGGQASTAAIVMDRRLRSSASSPGNGGAVVDGAGPEATGGARTPAGGAGVAGEAGVPDPGAGGAGGPPAGTAAPSFRKDASDSRRHFGPGASCSGRRPLERATRSAPMLRPVSSDSTTSVSPANTGALALAGC